MQVTLIAGGIGAGKSVVAAICRARGYEVYDCDAQARRLMQEDENFKRELAELTDKSVTDANGKIKSAVLAEYLFNDERIRRWVNQHVHEMVRRDMKEFCRQHEALHKERIFIESAIAAQAGLTAMADDCWLVDAPEDVRIQRVVMRGNQTGKKITPQQVKQRMDAQLDERNMLETSGLPIKIIINDNTTSLLLQTL